MWVRQATEGELEGTRATVAELTERLADAQQEGSRTAEALREAMAAQAERAEAQHGQLQVGGACSELSSHSSVAILKAP